MGSRRSEPCDIICRRGWRLALRFESTLRATTSQETLMRTAETRGTAIVTGASGAIGAVYADSRATALQQVEQGVRLFPAVRQAKKRAS
jgi:hypothetical protein